MNVPYNIVKSCLLAFVVFWMTIATKGLEASLIPFILLSIIPIVICVSIIVMVTIYPVFWMAVSPTFSAKAIFKTYFPYYSILSFALCFYSAYAVGFSVYPTAFFISAYVTTCQSWVWFTKSENR